MKKNQKDSTDATPFRRLIGSENCPPVILIHGFGEDSSVWDSLVEPLQSTFRFIIPDLPGSGQSEITGDMSMEGLADTVYKVMQQEKIKKCPVIGHSMGGYITLAFVEKYPESVSGFGLFHSTSFADSEEKKQVRQKGIAFIKQNGADAFLKTTIPNLFSAQTRDEKPELPGELQKLAHNFSGAALVNYYEAMIARPDRTSLLSQSPVPVLFIMGKHDQAVPVEDAMKQCHLPEKSYIHVLRNSGHMGMWEEPEKSRLAMEEFLIETQNI
jgi:pimeloyl-ACP methyl ester carboxylesterase